MILLDAKKVNTVIKFLPLRAVKIINIPILLEKKFICENVFFLFKFELCLVYSSVNNFSFGGFSIIMDSLDEATEKLFYRVLALKRQGKVSLIWSPGERFEVSSHEEFIIGALICNVGSVEPIL